MYHVSSTRWDSGYIAGPEYEDAIDRPTLIKYTVGSVDSYVKRSTIGVKVIKFSLK